MKSIGYVAFGEQNQSALSGICTLRGARTRATTILKTYYGYRDGRFGDVTVREVFVGEPIAKDAKA